MQLRHDFINLNILVSMTAHIIGIICSLQNLLRMLNLTIRLILKILAHKWYATKMSKHNTLYTLTNSNSDANLKPDI